MDVYVNFPANDRIRNMAERILRGINVSWYPDYHDTDVQIIKDRYVLGKKLKMIQTVSAGVDHIDIPGIPEEVVLCSNAGAYSISVAEHAMALMLARAKNVLENDREMKAGVFRQRPTVLLYGKTLGIYGYGGIGRRTAELAKAFGMKIAVYSRSVTGDDVMRATDLEELFRISDFLLIAVPLTDRTRGSVNARILSTLKDSATIINVARADIVVKEDMIRFLKEHPSVWYLSDVWWNEPEITETNIPNAILSPHVAGGMSGEIMDIAYEKAFENVIAFNNGHPQNVVRKDEYRIKTKRFLGI